MSEFTIECMTDKRDSLSVEFTNTTCATVTITSTASRDTELAVNLNQQYAHSLAMILLEFSEGVNNVSS